MITYLCCIYVLGIVIIGCDPNLKNIRRNNIWHFYTPIHVLSQDNHSNQNDWHTLNVKTVESSPVIFGYYEKQFTIYILHFWLFYKLDYFILLKKKIQTRDPIMRSKNSVFLTHTTNFKLQNQPDPKIISWVIHFLIHLRIICLSFHERCSY